MASSFFFTGFNQRQTDNSPYRITDHIQGKFNRDRDW